MNRKVLIVDIDEFNLNDFLGLKFDKIITQEEFTYTLEDHHRMRDYYKDQYNIESEAIEEYNAKRLSEEILNQYDPIAIREYEMQFQENIPKRTIFQSDIDRIEEYIKNFDKLESELIQGTDYMIVGRSIYDDIKNRYHLGLRNSNYYDIKNLDRLGLSTGIGLCFYDIVPSQSQLDKFLSDEWEKSDFKFPKSIILRKLEHMIPWFDYFIKLMDEVGFDYETDGFPLYEGSLETGFSISSDNHSVFFSVQDIRRNGEYKGFLIHFQRLLDKFDENNKRIWVYNQSFERNTTFQILGKLYKFHEAGIVNMIEQRNYKYFALKYTAQYLFKINSWDDQFDWIIDELEVLFDEYTTDNYQESEFYKDFNTSYPELISELDLLLSENWGRAYRCIPTEILGTYCNKDAYITLKIGRYLEDNYSNECIETFNNNVHFATMINTAGTRKDTKVFDEMYEICGKVNAFAITFLAYWYYLDLIKEFDGKVNKIEDYPENIRKCIELGIYDANYGTFARKFLEHFKDPGAQYGVDENKMIRLFGIEFTDKVTDYIDDCIGTYTNVGRSRKIYNWLEEDFRDKDFVLPDHLKEYNENTLTSLYYNECLKELEKVKSRMTHVMDIPKLIEIDGEKLDYDEYYEYIIREYCGLTSYLVYDELVGKVFNKYKFIDTFIYHLMESDKFYDDIFKFKECTTGDFLKDLERCKSLLPQIKEEYPEFIEDLHCDYSEFFDFSYKYMTLFRSFAWFYKEDWSKFLEYFYSPQIDQDTYFGYFKFMICTRLFKRYVKIKGTYMQGMLSADDEYVKPISDGISYSPHYPEEYKELGVCKMYPTFYPCSKQSKRWAAGWHTLPSKNEVKRVIAADPGKLLMYYDVSQAEVRTIAYKSKDPLMVKYYEEGIDLYVEAAKLFEEGIDWNDGSEYSYYRGMYKVTLLAKFYNESDAALAARTPGLEIDKAKYLSTKLRELYSTAFAYCDELTEYTYNTGKVKTILGDLIDLSDEPRWRQKTQAANQAIQGFTALAIADGMENICWNAYKQGLDITPHISVHDSATKSFWIKNLLQIPDFTYHYFTDYLFDKHQIKYLFSIFIGANYHDLCGLKKLSEDTIQLSGTNIAINEILKKMDGVVDFDVEFKNDLILPEHTDILTNFMNTTGVASFYTDTNYNKVKIKLNNI